VVFGVVVAVRGCVGRNKLSGGELTAVAGSLLGALWIGISGCERYIGRDWAAGLA